MRRDHALRAARLLGDLLLFGQQSGRVSLGLRDAFDLDRDRLHGLLKSIELRIRLAVRVSSQLGPNRSLPSSQPRDRESDRCQKQSADDEFAITSRLSSLMFPPFLGRSDDLTRLCPYGAGIRFESAGLKMTHAREECE